MRHFTAEQITEIGTRIFTGGGVPEAIARQVSRSLAESNLVGHDSHGIIRVGQYLWELEHGRIDPLAEVEVLTETPTSVLLNANWAFGQVAASQAMKVAIEKAVSSRLAAVVINRCNHIGRLGEYTLTAAEQGLIGIAAVNSGPPGGMVAPFGGRGRVLGANPISVAMPAGKNAFLLDVSTSICAEGKLRVARAQGEHVPEGWIVDKEGHPSTDPSDFYEGGAILTFGGHKGYGLSVFVELLCGALTGAGCPALPEWKWGNGVFMMAIEVEAFRPLAEFEDTVGRLFHAIKGGSTAPGFEEILIPGEPEFRTKQSREETGIPVPDGVWQVLVDSASKVGVDLADFTDNGLP